ncbi:MAG: TonB-dependent receptor [Pseudomonadota bacterium]
MNRFVIGAACLSAALPSLASAQSAQQIADRDRNAEIVGCVEAGQSELRCKRDIRPVRLDKIEVFGDRPVDGVGSTAILTEDFIADISADHPAEVLNRLPGVNIHTNSGQEHLIAIRSPVLTGGAGQGSFLILENGVPTRSPAFGNVNALLEPHHETAEFIEVVRGPGSAKYGSNAVHGLVNVILADPRSAEVETRASYGSLGRYKGDLIVDQGYLVRGAISLQDDVGWRDNTGLVQGKASGVAETTLAGWGITAWTSGSWLEQETADFIEGPDAYEDRDIAKANDDPLANRNAWSWRGAARFERSVGDGSLAVTPFVRSQQMDFRQHFLPNKSFEKNGHTGGGVMLRYAQDFGDGSAWRIGSDIDVATGYLRETQDDPFGFFPGDSRFPVGVHYDYSVDTIMAAVWTEIDLALTDKVEALIGLRAEAHEYDYTTDAPAGVNGRFNVPEDRTDDFDFVAPKLGLLYRFDDAREAYVQYSRGARAPQASDLYRIQSLQQPSDADVETLDSIEIGMRGTLVNGDLIYDIAAYHMEKDNFFFRDSDGLNVTDGTTRHQGIEVAMDWALTRQFRLTSAVSWSDQVYTFTRDVGNASEVITDGNEIDTAPSWLGDIALVWSPTDRFETELSAEYVGEYFTNPSNTQTYPGHTVFSLRGFYRFDDTLEGFVTVRNLFDETYADRADFAFGNERYFPGEPLNATIGIRKSFR